MDDSKLKNILYETRNIAVVGLSPKPDRPSHGVASFLKEKGYRIIPVIPSSSWRSVVEYRFRAIR